MADEATAEPAAYSGALSPAELPVLSAYVEEIGRWVLGDAVGSTLSSELCDSLSGELAAILAGGLAPSLAAEIERNTRKHIVDAQDGPVRFDALGRLTVGGLDVQDVVRLIAAAGQLVENGLGDSGDMLHQSHRSALYAAHDAWTAGRNGTGTTRQG